MYARNTDVAQENTDEMKQDHSFDYGEYGSSLRKFFPELRYIIPCMPIGSQKFVFPSVLTSLAKKIRIIFCTEGMCKEGMNLQLFVYL